MRELGLVILVAIATTIVVMAPGVPATRKAAAQAPVNSTFVNLMPELRNAPAPGWVKSGTRITFYSASATVTGGRHYYYQDENGNWVDPQTGKRFSQGDVASASGHGYTQLTVVHLDQSVAVLDLRNYVFTDVSGPLVLGPSAGFAGLPGAAGDYWLHPQALARAVGTRAEGLTIVRMPYTMNGRQFRAIRIQIAGATSYQAWVYDEDLGLLLRGSTSTQGAPIQGPVGQGDSRAGGTLLTQTTAVEVRQINVPWMFAPMPAWVAQTRFMRFDGKHTSFVAGASLPMAGTLERQFLGPNWAAYLQRDPSQSGDGGTLRVFGPAQLAGLWIAPSLIGQLQQGQKLDTDRFTGVVTTVERIGQTQGIDFVQIVEESSGYRGDYVYDRRDGGLVYTSIINKYLRTQVELRLVQRQ